MASRTWIHFGHLLHFRFRIFTAPLNLRKSQLLWIWLWTNLIHCDDYIVIIMTYVVICVLLFFYLLLFFWDRESASIKLWFNSKIAIKVVKVKEPILIYARCLWIFTPNPSLEPQSSFVIEILGCFSRYQMSCSLHDW